MRKCPLSYDQAEGRYLPSALRRLHPRLTDMDDLPLTSQELRQEAAERADKLSIQGVQPKLSARLSLKHQRFELIDRGGRFILKPQHPQYQAVPENEDLTMKLAAFAGIEVPDHGLVYTRDGELTYWIRRFDRVGRHGKLPLEDFAQLLGESRDTKYRSSLEKVAEALERFATFPQIEAAKLLRVVLFCFLCGNEDHHLKNFSLLTESGLVRFSPAYDLLCTTILLKRPKEELALPLRGKKSKLNPDDLLDYYAKERLGLTDPVIEQVMVELAQGFAVWPQLLERSFLPGALQRKYAKLVTERLERLGFRLVHLSQGHLDGLDKTLLRQLRRQHHEGWLCLTAAQLEQLHSPPRGKDKQSAYRRLARLLEADSAG